MTVYPRTRRTPDGKPRPSSPYMAWTRATDPDTRLQVAEDNAAQAQARALIAAGMVAYENRAGLVRDVGWPRNGRDAGRVFTRRTAGR